MAAFRMRKTKDKSATKKAKSIEAISQLRNSHHGQSMVLRIGGLLDHIEQSQCDGISLLRISKALAKTEFPGMDVKCLQNLLYQARRAKKKQSTTVIDAGIPAPQPVLVSCHSMVAKANDSSHSKTKTQTDSTGGIDPGAILHAASHAVSAQRFSTATRSLLLKKENTLIDKGDRK